MPFTTAHEIGMFLPPPPTTQLPGNDEGWATSYYSERPKELFRPKVALSGLGSAELEVLKRLPSKLVKALAEEATDPAFVREYLRPALHSSNPFKKITGDMAEEIYEDLEDRAHGDLGMGKKKKGFFKKMIKKQRAIHSKVRPKFMKKIHKKISKGAKKVWKQYGSIIISVIGAILAPFTGGASVAAAAVIVAAKTIYDKKQAAAAAKKAGKVEAGAMAAEAAKQEADTAKTVDQFYKDNTAWFLKYDLTPDKWAKLTLDQKIEFISAGVEGRIPKGAIDKPMTEKQEVAQVQHTVQVAKAVGIPPAAVVPPGTPGGPPPAQGTPGGPGEGASYQSGGSPQYGPPPAAPGGPTDSTGPGQGPGEGYDTSAGEQPAGGEQPSGSSGDTFEVKMEKGIIGPFTTLDDAYAATINETQPGDRFEVFQNGKSLGLSVRTAEGAVEVPPEAEGKMRQMSTEESHAVVEGAEKEAKSGGVPWLAILGGGAVIALVAANS